MTIDEDRDPELRQSLSEAIGEPQADRLMTLLPDRPMSELATRDDLADVKSDVAELKADVAELKSDVAELKSDVAELKSDVAELKTDVAQLKTDVAELKAEFGEMKVQFAEMKADVVSQVLTYTLALGSLITVVLCTILGVGLTGGFA